MALLMVGAVGCSNDNALEDPAAQQKPVKAYVDAVQAKDVDRVSEQAEPGVDGRAFAQAKVTEFGGRFTSHVKVDVKRGDANLANATITATDGQQRFVTDTVGLTYSSSEKKWFVAMNTAPPSNDGTGPSPAASALPARNPPPR
ncbi:hypothetical protein [Pilimelia terevasa]|uniref:hypothetical protein n=1 Tax=Pilimelia terevasa TaxID=53372 RepID=UPI00166A31D0|nr:hypothetical protein [Pilimelia terevasa]